MSGCRSGSSTRKTSSPICRRPSTLRDPLPVRAGKTVLSLRWPVDLRLTVASHGWANLAPWCWDLETGRLGRHERIGKRLGRIEVAQRDPVSMVLLWEGFDAAALPVATANVDDEIAR